jgi:hypothetical protein
MGKSTASTEDTVPAGLFIAFTFSIAGWALLELSLLQTAAGLRAQGMAALWGLWLCLISIRRPRIGRAAPQNHDSLTTREHRKPSRPDAIWAVLLLVMGGTLGTLVLLGQIMVLGAACFGLVMVRWSRISFFRYHFLAACTAVLTGMALIIGPDFRSIDPIVLPIASWVFWAFATISILLRIEQLARAERVSKVPPPSSPAFTL